MFRLKSALIACTLCAASLGCSKKVPECNALVKQLNESSTAMQSATTGLMTNPKQAKEALEKLAVAQKAETDKLAKVELSVSELQGFSKKYQTLLGEMVTSAQAIGKASGEVEGIQEAVTKSQAGWTSAANKLGTACIKARKECARHGDKLTQPPLISGIKPAEDAKKLDEYAKGLASLDVKSADVKAAVDDIKKHVADLSSALSKNAVTQEALEKATKAMTEAGGKEPALVKSINDFCQAG
jgi:chromosome segregation ATPase